MSCLNCKKLAKLRPWKGRTTMMGVPIETIGMRCRACGTVIFAAKEVRRQEREIAKGVVERGIRTGPELSLVRKLAGLRATDVASMLDVTPETVSRWERGKVPIPRSTAYVIGELYAHPRVARAKLEAFAR